MTLGDTASTKMGVIGTGSMGQHHARVYSELANAELVGVTDVDEDRAARVADDYRTTVMDRDQLFERVDGVSVAVPTEFHYPVVSACIDHGIDVLVEKPFVSDPARGVELIDRAADEDVAIQVGHVERFNPAVSTLYDIIDDLDVISIRAQRLGPPPNQDVQDSVIFDLMIHDIDVVLTLLGEEPAGIKATSIRNDDHATALFQFPSETVATLIASRVTQRKVRILEITAEDCLVSVDYLDRTVEIHRRSRPEYIERQGDMRYRHQGVVERPVVENGEPLRRELASFVEAVASGRTPDVTAEQGLRAVEYAQRLSSLTAADAVSSGPTEVADG